MLETVKKAKQNINALNINKMVQNILIDRRSDVFKILKDEQLGLGKDSKGRIIGRYSTATEIFASDPQNRPRKPKQAGQPYNFEWTGETFDSMFLHFESKDSYSLFSSDEKALFLQGKYGNIFDLTEAHNDRINYEIILPELDDQLANKFNNALLGNI